MAFEQDITEVAKGSVPAPGGREKSKSTDCEDGLGLAQEQGGHYTAGTWASGREEGSEARNNERPAKDPAYRFTCDVFIDFPKDK